VSCSTAGQRIMVAAGDLVLPPDTMEACLVLLVIESKNSVSKKEGIWTWKNLWPNYSHIIHHMSTNSSRFSPSCIAAAILVAVSLVLCWLTLKQLIISWFQEWSASGIQDLQQRQLLEILPWPPDLINCCWSMMIYISCNSRTRTQYEAFFPRNWIGDRRLSTMIRIKIILVEMRKPKMQDQ
jgi:hypothetical protein